MFSCRSVRHEAIPYRKITVMQETRTGEEQRAPLIAAPQEAEELQVRPLRVATAARNTEALTPYTGNGQVVVARPKPRLQRRKPAIRQLEEALNGGDSPHRAYADLFTALSICLSSGMSITAALERAAQDATPELQEMCADLAAQIAGGATVQAAFARRQGQMPEVVLPLLEHGIQHGTLESATRRVAQVLTQFARLDTKFAYSALRPDLTLPLLLCGTLPFLPFWIESLPLFAAYGVGCIGISVAVWRHRHGLARRTPRGRLASRLALARTRQGMANRHLNTARWARTFAVLYDYGVPISTALEAAAPAACNPHYAEALRRAAQRTREGRPLSESLAQTELLPAHLLELIRTGETTGDLGETLDRFADTLEEDAKMLAAQRFGMQVVAALFIVAGFAVGNLSPAAGALVIVLGMVITWLLFLSAARNDL